MPRKERRTPVDKRVRFEFEGRQISARELIQLNPHGAVAILQKLRYDRAFFAVLSEIGGKAGAMRLYDEHKDQWNDIERNLLEQM